MIVGVISTSSITRGSARSPGGRLDHPRSGSGSTTDIGPRFVQGAHRMLLPLHSTMSMTPRRRHRGSAVVPPGPIPQWDRAGPLFRRTACGGPPFGAPSPPKRTFASKSPRDPGRAGAVCTASAQQFGRRSGGTLVRHRRGLRRGSPAARTRRCGVQRGRFAPPTGVAPLASQHRSAKGMIWTQRMPARQVGTGAVHKDQAGAVPARRGSARGGWHRSPLSSQGSPTPPQSRPGIDAERRDGSSLCS